MSQLHDSEGGAGDKNLAPGDKTSLVELAKVFFWIGSTAFGGPAVHLAIIEREFVRRRGWLTHEQFADMYGATNLIPGPNSTEMAIHIGYNRRGYVGLLVAGVSFIFPAAAMVTVLAWAYVRYQHSPQVDAVLYGIEPVMIAVVLQAFWNLRGIAKTPLLRVLGALSIIGGLCEKTLARILPGWMDAELAILFAAAFFTMGLRALELRKEPRSATPVLLGIKGLKPVLLAVGAVGAIAPTYAKIFLLFLKIGSILFGSGYVLMAFLRPEVVEHYHWITNKQLLDAFAVGQVTPGPVFTTATFIGYIATGGHSVRAGLAGATAATAGIFLPAFVFVAISAPFLPKLRKNKLIAAFLDGLNVASVGLMFAVAIQLGITAIRDAPTTVLLVLSLFLLVRFKVNSTALLALGVVVGIAHWRLKG